MAVRKTSLAPITREMKMEQAKKNPQDSEHIIEGSNLDAYMKMAENDNIVDLSEKEAEIDSLKETISQMKLENTSILSRLDKADSEKFELKIENEKLKKEILDNEEIKNLKDKVESLSNELDKYRLEQSELNLEITRLKNVNVELQNKLDGLNRVGTKNGYTVTVMKDKTTGFHSAMNGYQDWN